MKDKIIHDGIVQQVSVSKITVVIINASACASCHAKGACISSDMKEKEIDIVRFSGEYHVGQQVNVIGYTSQGMKAVFFSYFLPFILVITTLFSVISLTKSEGVAGVLSLLMLIPYYGVLYLFRNSLKGSFEFEISATINPST